MGVVHGVAAPSGELVGLGVAGLARGAGRGGVVVLAGRAGLLVKVVLGQLADYLQLDLALVCQHGLLSPWRRAKQKSVRRGNVTESLML